jgi:opacity protein-like surface antigen
MNRKPAEFSVSSIVGALFLVVILGLAALAQTPDQQNSDQQNSAQPPAAQQQGSDQQQGSAQQPSGSQSGNEEATPEEATPRHRTKPKEFKNWNFNAGGGANIGSGQTKKFVIGGGGTFGGGVARNFNKYFGFRLDVLFNNLPLRNTAFLLAQAPGGNNHVYTATLDPIINIPATRLWSGYVVFGPSYLHRSGKLDSSTAVPGSACNPFWAWWGRCFAGSLPLTVDFLRASQNQFGYNVGGGIARKVYNNIEIYAEFRIIHGDHNNITTDIRPITMGVRW